MLLKTKNGNLKKKRILVTDHVHIHLLDGLKELDFGVVYEPDIPYLDIFPVLCNFDGIVINSKVKMTRELMLKSERLQFIARLGSGLDIIDLPAAKELGISVFSAPEGNRNAVAEHAMGMLLSLTNQLIQADQDVRNRSWDREARRGWEIEGKKIGIIGFGNNGSCFAEKLAGFGVEVLVYDKYKKDFSEPYSHVRECSLEYLQKESDIISLHVPLDNNTHYMIDGNFISNCKDGVIIINSARGKVIKMEALIEGLGSKKIGGVCLDVFENEKPHTYTENESVMYGKLHKFNNAIFSPHIAGWTHESKYKIANSLLKQISNLAT